MRTRKKIFNEEPSNISKYRKKVLKQGYELVDITQLCEFKLGNSGWCNGFNESKENIYHVQIWYRDECIGNMDGRNIYPIDEERFCVFVDEDSHDNDFIVFRKVPV